MPDFSCQLASAKTSTTAAIAPPLSIQLCLSWDELNPFRDAWEKILRKNSASSIFMTPEWLGSWWQTFGATKKLTTLVFLDQDRHPVAIAPMFRESASAFPRYLKMLRLVGAGSGDSDGLDFPIQPGYEKEVAKAFLDWLSRASLWDICSLETLPSGSALGRHLEETLNQRNYRVSKERISNFYIDLPETWEAYLASLDPQFRPLLTRYPRRLQSRHRMRVFRCEAIDDLPMHLRALFKLHQMRWTEAGETGAFSNRLRRNFYLCLGEALLRRGWLEFWLLQLEDEIAAAQFCFRYGKTAYLLQEGFNPRYAAEKVGYALRAHVLQQMIRTGATRYDFLGGDDPYKRKFGGVPGNYKSLHFAGHSLLGRVYLAQRDYTMLARRWLKDHLPEPALAALRHSTKKQTAGAGS
jgi:CelD/BcsL family acetyltransferase involved in cellulose biosynthesis